MLTTVLTTVAPILGILASVLTILVSTKRGQAFVEECFSKQDGAPRQLWAWLKRFGVSAVLALYAVFGMAYYGLHHGFIVLGVGVELYFSAFSFHTGLVCLMLVLVPVSACVAAWRKPGLMKMQGVDRFRSEHDQIWKVYEGHKKAWDNALEEADPIKYLTDEWDALMALSSSNASYETKTLFDEFGRRAHDQFEEFTRRANDGEADARYGLGRMHDVVIGNVPFDREEAVKYYRLAAKQDHLVAQLRLADMYSIDEAESAEWVRCAAEQGHPLAQYELGDRYRDGKGVPENEAEAVKWWQCAANQGHALAQNMLGLLYAIGEGVPRDLVQAHKWLNLAAAGGAEDADEHKSYWEDGMSRAQIDKAKQLAVEFKPIRNSR